MPSDLWEDLADVHPAFKDFAENFARYSGTSKEVFLGQLSVAVKVYGEAVAREARAEGRMEAFKEAAEIVDGLCKEAAPLGEADTRCCTLVAVGAFEEAATAIRQAGEKVSDETPEGARE